MAYSNISKTPLLKKTGKKSNLKVNIAEDECPGGKEIIESQAKAASTIEHATSGSVKYLDRSLILAAKEDLFCDAATSGATNSS